MREKLWLRLRSSKLLRRLSSVSILARPMRVASYLLLPSLGRKQMRVRGGLGKDLVMELFPRWEAEVWEGVYEMEVQQLFAQHVRAGTIFYDVGGGSGFYSMVAARLGAQVIVFEASAENGASISHHLKRNSLESHVRLIRSAVFSHTGFVSVQGNTRETGHGNYRVQAVDPESTQLTRVSCTTLDDFVKENPRPDFVKIDVEGAESEVLKGAETLFCAVRPLLVCEIHDEANASFVTRWLKEKNYKSRWLEDGSRFPRHLYASPLGSVA